MIEKVRSSWQLQVHILWVGQLILITAISMSNPFWPLILQKSSYVSATTLPYWNMAIYLAPFAFTMLSAPFWGKIADQFGYKKMVLRAAWGIAITQAGMAFTSNPEFILLLRIAQGLFCGFIATAQAWSMQVTPPEKKGRVIANLQSATSLGTIGGPFLGGLIAHYISYQKIFSYSAIISFIASLSLAIFLIEPISEAVKSTSSSNEKPKLLTILSNKNIYFLLIVITMAQTARMIIMPFFALFVTEQLQGNNLTISLTYSATGISLFLFTPLWGRYIDRLNQKKKSLHTLILLLFLSSALIQGFFAFANHVFAAMILRFVWGICLAGILPTLFTLLTLQTLKNIQGQTIGLGHTANKFGSLLGILLGSVVQLYFGNVIAILAMTLIYTFGVIVLAFNKKSFPVLELAEPELAISAD